MRLLEVAYEVEIPDHYYITPIWLFKKCEEAISPFTHLAWWPSLYTRDSQTEPILRTTWRVVRKHILGSHLRIYDL